MQVVKWVKQIKYENYTGNLKIVFFVSMIIILGINLPTINGNSIKVFFQV